MKLMIVPPAQAEALFDAWHDDAWYDDELGETNAADTRRDSPASQPGRRARIAEAVWRDDPDEPASEPRRTALAAPSFGPAL